MGILGRYDDAEDRVLPARAWRYDDSDDSASQSGESQDEHLAYVFFSFLHLPKSAFGAILTVAYNSGDHLPLAAHQTMGLALARHSTSPRGEWT